MGFIRQTRPPSPSHGAPRFAEPARRLAGLRLSGRHAAGAKDRAGVYHSSATMTVIDIKSGPGRAARGPGRRVVQGGVVFAGFLA